MFQTDGSGEMTHQFSQLTLTPQSSTELPEPPGGAPHQQSQQQQPQQQMYVLTSPSQPSSQQPGMPQMAQQPQQMQPQQGFVPTQQVKFNKGGLVLISVYSVYFAFVHDLPGVLSMRLSLGLFTSIYSGKLDGHADETTKLI